MADTTIEKVEAGSSPRGEMGQKYLVAGKHVSMRLWIIDEPGVKLKAPTTRDYETVGYVISGSAKLDLEGQTLNLKAGDSWLVPAGAAHQYTIMNPSRLSRQPLRQPKSTVATRPKHLSI